MKGIIQADGSVLGKDDNLYHPRKVDDKILIVCSSWSTYKIEDVKGKEVEFIVTLRGHGYNYKLTK